jgi:processing peptidase subunit beta
MLNTSLRAFRNRDFFRRVRLASPRRDVLYASNLFSFSTTTSKSLPSYLLNIPPTLVSTLPNKLRVASEETPGETATVGVYIDAGSAFEDEKNNGVAHFLEHMAFKGTSSRTREGLEVEIENMGGHLNAYTSREQTVYYAKVFRQDIPKAVEILSDILLNSTYESAAVDAERSTILREMEEVGKDINEVIFDYLHATAYQGTPLGRPILGPAENVKSITRDDLIKYVQQHYQAPRMVLAASGPIKHQELVTLAEKHFQKLPFSGPFQTRTPKKFTGSMITERDDGMPLAHVAVSIESVGWSHPDYYTFLVIQTLLGNWDRSIGGGKNLSSKLCEIIATEELAHSLSTFNTCYSDTGLFGNYITAPPGEHLEDAICEVFNEYNRIGKLISDEEVEQAKGKLKAALLMQLDGTTAICEDIGRQILTHSRRLSPAEVFLRIDAISAKDVRRVAKDHFEDVCPAVSAVGNIADLPDYNQIRGWTYWNRW